MKTTPRPISLQHSGYALIMVLGLSAAVLIALVATLNRTMTNARLNMRSVEYTICLDAAEAACEKVYTKMAYDFETAGLGQVQRYASNSTLAYYYPSIYPNASDNSYWSQFTFSDAQGNANATYVQFLTSYTGPLPSQLYPNWSTAGAPVYRIVSNATRPGSATPVTAAMQMDVLLALVPMTSYAIFYAGNLEFTGCATMIVNGRVQCNANLYYNTPQGSSLTFNNLVTVHGVIDDPVLDGRSVNNQGSTSFKGGYRTNALAVTLAIGNTNAGNLIQTIANTNYHSLIELPPSGESANSAQGQIRYYNEADTVLLVNSTSVTYRVQAATSGSVPGADPAPTIITTNYTGLTYSNITSLFPFLSLSNSFYDQREERKIYTSQIDVGKYAKWIQTNSLVQGKLPASSGLYPKLLYVADTRYTNISVTSNPLSAVRLTNGAAPPSNGGNGFSVVTPNPLYVMGNYNCTNPANLSSTNTSGTVSCALMSDALTILSSYWKDSACSSSTYNPTPATNTTVNAAILTGNVVSTGTSSTTFSGGVHNLPRLLEDWGSASLTLNTSIINLYQSTLAIGQFLDPNIGDYYSAPTRKFSFDTRFNDPANQPPGIPCALLAVRFNCAQPGPGTVTYAPVP